MRVDLGFVEVTVRLKRDGFQRALEFRKYEVVSRELRPDLQRRLWRQLKGKLRQHAGTTT